MFQLDEARKTRKMEMAICWKQKVMFPDLAKFIEIMQLC